MRDTTIRPLSQQTGPVLDAVERVSRSRFFAASPRLQAFLRYSVSRTLEGEFAELKEVCIGMAVFMKPPSYDPKEDPIVRVEARRLRARLDDYYSAQGAGDPIRITLPKGGYQVQILEQFREQVQDVQPSWSTAVIPEPIQVPPSEPTLSATTRTRFVQCVTSLFHRFSKPMLILGSVGVFAFLAGAGTILLQRLNHPKPLHFSRVVPLAGYSGTERQPAISHQGSQMAFVWGGEDGRNYDIYVKLLDIGTAVRLTANPAHDLAPHWSPDDRFISFERVTPQGVGVYVIPALGGSERKVTDVHIGGAWVPDALQVQKVSGAAWTSDSKALIVTDQIVKEQSSVGGEGLFVVQLDGSSRQRLTSPPRLATDYNVSLSHNGRRMAFVRDTTNSSGDIYTADSDGSHLRQVTFDRRLVRGLAWAPDDRSLVFASNRGGSDGLWQVSDAGGTPEPVAAKGDEIDDPSLSIDGSILAYTAINQNANIWRMPLTTQGAPTLLIGSSGRNSSPKYSPDGQKIVFVSDRSGAWELWVSDSDGHAQQQVTNFGGSMVGTPHWSPDSRSLVFDARPGGRSVIFTVTLDGTPPIRVVDDGFEDKKPNWSRDGRSLYYTSNRNGISQLWRSGIHGENPIQLTADECDDSYESADGRSIYFQRDRNGIYRMPVRGGKAEILPALATVYPSRYFFVANDIYFVDRKDGLRRLLRYNADNGIVSAIRTITGPLLDGTPSLGVSPDGRYAIFAQQDSSRSEIMTLRR